MQSKQMRSARQLSRLSITGHIHEHTPLCVLIEIADAHGIKYDQKDFTKPNFNNQLLASIHQTSVPTVSGANDLIEWQYIARFVNKHSQWPQTKLTQAYNFLINFTANEDPLTKISQGFSHGIQTPDNPFAVNACVLYKICIHHRLNTNSRTTITQMAYAVEMLYENVESVVRRVKSFVERDAKRIDLINMLMLSPHEVQDPNPVIMDIPINPNTIPKTNADFEMLRTLHGFLNDIKTLQQRADPGTACGSVALAAINFGTDISRATDPTREYRILKLSGRAEYKPVDSWMNYWYKLNPNLFDIDVTFNPIFPSCYYNINRMQVMATNEGYCAAEINSNDPYELLSMNYVAETFYLGEMPNMKSRQTPIELDDVEDIPYGQLVCFGQYDAPLQPMSIKELADLFNANQNFTNPLQQNSVFTSNAIGKLKFIASSPGGPNPNVRLPADTVMIRNQLLEAINGVEMTLKTNDEPTRQFAFSYRNAAPDTKTVIRNALANLLHIGMYMRGWSGVGEYPVIKAPVPVEREPEVAVNVTKAIADYETLCRSLGKLGVQINNLPLVRYRDHEYQVAISDQDGRTIGQRLAIVKRGDETDNVASCIRLSSNWICASAHKYIIALGIQSPFDIFNLRDIS